MNTEQTSPAPTVSSERLLERREHTWYECHCESSTCMFCAGGLGACTVCNGFEGTLTTECCGRPITEDETRRIYDEGTLDYKDGRWVNEPNFPRSNVRDELQEAARK